MQIDPVSTSLRLWLPRLLAGLMLVLGLAYLVTGLMTSISFAWPHPVQDQFRLYPIYLEQPFPENVLQSENGHRPIIPGLIRVLEIHLMDANQKLQIFVGLLCALLTALTVAAVATREHQLPLVARATGFAAALISVFWLANARMLMHGNELVHAYLLTLSVVLGALCVWQAGRGSPWRWMGAASLLGIVATFSFGPGLAAFPAFIIAAWVGGVPRRTLIVPTIALAFCLMMYLVILPGDGGVRGSLAIEPLQNLVAAARWISSPWINAWLGFADPPLNAFTRSRIEAGNGAFVVDSARWFQSATGLKWSTTISALIGFFGFAVLGCWLMAALIRKQARGRTDLLAGVLMMFGAASALIVGTARLGYLEARPDQVFADRYLIWPCLFWLGVLLALLSRPGRVGQFSRPLAVTFALIAAVVLVPTHRYGAGWGSTVYNNAHRAAFAVQSGLLPVDLVTANDPSAPFDAKLRAYELFRERELAMFSQPGSTSMGQPWLHAIDDEGGVLAHLFPPRTVNDHREGVTGLHVQGQLDKRMKWPAKYDVVAALDPAERIVGLGGRSFAGHGESALRVWPPHKRGFDLYIRNYSPGMQYRIVALDFDRQRGRLLALLPAVEK